MQNLPKSQLFVRARALPCSCLRSASHTKCECVLRSQIMPKVVKDGRINTWLKHSNDVTNWKHMVCNMVFRDWPTNSSDDEEVDCNDDEGCKYSRNEPSMKVPRQTPNNNRSRNMGNDKNDAMPGRMQSVNPNMTKDEAIKILAVNRDHSIREVKVKKKCRMLVIKFQVEKWDERCYFTKEDIMDTLKGVANTFDFLKWCYLLCSCSIVWNVVIINIRVKYWCMIQTKTEVWMTSCCKYAVSPKILACFYCLSFCMLFSAHVNLQVWSGMK